VEEYLGNRATGEGRGYLSNALALGIAELLLCDSVAAAPADAFYTLVETLKQTFASNRPPRYSGCAVENKKVQHVALR